MIALIDEALDTQLTLAELFTSSLGEQFAKMLLDRHEWSQVTGTPREIFEDVFSYAPTYVVTADMMKVLAQGHRQLVEEGKTPSLDLEWLPSPQGFCLFESGFELVTESVEFDRGIPEGWPTPIPPRERPVRAVWWQHSPISYHSAGPRSPYKAGKGVLMGLGMRMEDAFREPEPWRGKVPSLVPFDVTGWSAEIPWKIEEDAEARKEGTGLASQAGAEWRWMMIALWSLLSQRIESRRGSRKALRRRKRSSVAAPPDYGDVNVVTLRSIDHPRRESMSMIPLSSTAIGLWCQGIGGGSLMDPSARNDGCSGYLLTKRGQRASLSSSKTRYGC